MTFRRQRFILTLSITAYTVLFSALAIWKYRHFGYNALDLAIINNSLAETLRGHFFGSSIHAPTYLADHFTPGLLLLLPAYTLAPRPETLLFLQALAIALCAWPVFLIARSLLQTTNYRLRTYAPPLASTAWLLNPFVHNLTLFEFHALPFALLPILFAVWLYLEKRFAPFVVMLGMALLVQEDVALVVAMFGVLALVERRPRRWWFIPLAGAGMYFIGSMKLISQFNPSGYKFLIYYGWLGNTPTEMVLNAVLQPWRWILQLLRPQNLIFIPVALLPFAFLPVLGRRYLILCVGSAAQLFLGSAGGSTVVLSTHYMTLLLPGLVTSSLAGIQSWTQGSKHWPDALQILWRQQPLAVMIAVVCVTYSLFTLGPAQAITQITRLRDQGNSRAQEITPLASHIPENAPVAASYDTLATFSSRPGTTSLNYAFLGTTQYLAKPYELPTTTEYLLVDFGDLVTYDIQYRLNPFYARQYELALERWPQVLDDFSVIEQRGTHAALRRGSTGRPLINLMAAEQSAPAPLHDFAGTRLLKLDKTTDGWAAIWELGEKPERPIMLNLRLQTDPSASPFTLYPLPYTLPFAYGLIPPSEWHAGKLVEVFYPDFFPDAPSGARLELRLLQIKSGGIDLDALRSTFPTIDEIDWLGEPFLISVND